MSKVPQQDQPETTQDKSLKELDKCSSDPAWPSFETKQFNTQYNTSCPEWSLQHMEPKSWTKLTELTFEQGWPVDCWKANCVYQRIGKGVVVVEENSLDIVVCEHDKW